MRIVLPLSSISEVLISPSWSCKRLVCKLIFIYYFFIYFLFHLLISWLDAITRAMYEVCEDAVADGIRYIEIRFSPILHTREGLSLRLLSSCLNQHHFELLILIFASEIMEAAREGQAMAQYKFSIVVNIIVCGMRHLDPSVTKALAEIAWRYKHKGYLFTFSISSRHQLLKLDCILVVTLFFAITY